MPVRVVLVDDHALMRDGLKALLLRHDGIEVVGEAADGREALHEIARQHPDVVVLDLTMPNLNGLDALRELRAREGERVRVVVSSMHSSHEHVSQAFAAGANGYVLKESAGTELALAIMAVSRGDRYLCSRLRGKDLEASADGARTPIASLSTRERQVLQLVAEGRSSAEIAAVVHLSPKTIDTYRSRMMKKLGVKDLAGLVRFAVQHGLTPAG